MTGLGVVSPPLQQHAVLTSRRADIEFAGLGVGEHIDSLLVFKRRLPIALARSDNALELFVGQAYTVVARKAVVVEDIGEHLHYLQLIGDGIEHPILALVVLVVTHDHAPEELGRAR